ncbi:MAG: hypothetical protein Q9N26_07875 [Aquificota bacterium]|nr:hypothetical protein [Aquificota bacterium]
MRTFGLHLIFVILSITSLAYIDSLKEESNVFSPERSVATDVSIKVVSEKGEEWLVEGTELISLGREVRLRRVLMRSGAYTVVAREVLIDRRKKTARLKGDVQIRGDALFVKTDSAHVDFNRDLITGEGGVSLWRGTNYFEGKGFEVRLRPLRVIIGGVRAKHEI